MSDKRGKRKFHGNCALSAREAVRRKVQASGGPIIGPAWICLEDVLFFETFPEPEERAAFQFMYPRKFWELWAVFTDPLNEHPGSHEYAIRDIFKRPETEFLAMLRVNPPRVPFDPPRLPPTPVPWYYRRLAVHRGRWWKTNGYPMTEKERVFLSTELEGDEPPAAETCGPTNVFSM
ncbi:MAG: hypothetical protein KIT09_02595 [Bryobacteraceae bacterium]|nr:hypothetical protein [Bryobacteraceae bacterium]